MIICVYAQILRFCDISWSPYKVDRKIPTFAVILLNLVHASSSGSSSFFFCTTGGRGTGGGGRGEGGAGMGGGAETAEMVRVWFFGIVSPLYGDLL